MNLKRLLSDDEAVSPVIGVILMVAITVILAAVIGTFVLGLGDQVQQTAPTAQLSADQTTETLTVQNTTLGNTENIDNSTLEVSHEGGDKLSGDNVDVTVNGNTAWGYDGSVDPHTPTEVWGDGEDISAGSSITIVAAFDEDSADDVVANGQYEFDGSTTNGLHVQDPSASSFTGTYNNVGLQSGDTVRVTWQSDEGRSSTLLERDIN